MKRLDEISEQFKNTQDDPDPTADVQADPSPDDPPLDAGEDEELGGPTTDDSGEAFLKELMGEVEEPDTSEMEQAVRTTTEMLYPPDPFPPVGICELTSSLKWKELYATSGAVVDYVAGRIVTATGANKMLKLNASQGIFVACNNLSATRYVFLPNGAFPVTVEMVNGAQGVLNSATQSFCAFNYKIKLKGSSIVLTTSAAPEYPRLFPGPMTSAVTGLAYWDGQNGVKLLSVGEQIKTSIFVNCS